MLRYGIVQGRLIQSPPGELQWFPQQRWEEEFSLAASVGIDYIELIAERSHNPSNPLWSDAGIARIKAAVADNKRTLHALCNDYIIDHSLPNSAETLKQNLDLLDQGHKLGCEKYVLPLFEESEMDLHDAELFAPALRAIADKARDRGMMVCLETILNGADLIEVFGALNHPNIFAVYDTGNRVAFGHDLPGDIKMLGKSRIAHVHIKDKNSDNQNVLLGTGLVNFHAVFRALADIGYEGPFTFETQRGRDPLRTARYNMEVVDYFFHEAVKS